MDLQDAQWLAALIRNNDATFRYSPADHTALQIEVADFIQSMDFYNCDMEIDAFVEMCCRFQFKLEVMDILRKVEDDHYINQRQERIRQINQYLNDAIAILQQAIDDERH